MYIAVACPRLSSASSRTSFATSNVQQSAVVYVPGALLYRYEKILSV